MAGSGVSSQWLAFLSVCFCLRHRISAGNVNLQQPDRPTSLAIAEGHRHNGLPKTLRESRYAKLPHIVDYACAAAETARPGNFDPEKCNATAQTSMLYCPIASTVGFFVETLWTEIGKDPSVCYSANNWPLCAYFPVLTLSSFLVKERIDALDPDLQNLCWRTGPDGLPISFSIARDLVQGCRLAHPLPGCPLLQDGEIQDVSNDYILAFTAKMVMLGAVLFDDTLAPSTSLHKDLCWEPELRDAYSLYQRPGPWQVNEECVQMLQDLAKKMVMHVSRTFLSSPNLKGIKDAPDWWPLAVELLTDVFSGSSDVFLQRFVFPSFQRFKDTARQRRGSVATGHEVQSSVVSCHGLQGGREQVEGNLVQLLRLVLVNDIHLFQHDTLAYVFTSFANHFLHCTLLLFI